MADQKVKIGKKIKDLRNKKGLSLEELAKESEISTAALTAIEEHKVSPPLGQIVSLANAFRISVGELLGDSADSPFCIVRSNERKPVARFDTDNGTSSGYHYESLGHKKQNRQMEPFLVTLTPSGEPHSSSNQHVGEEILFVLDGQVEINLAGHTDIFKPGDSIYYDSNLPHSVSCHGDKPATLLAVIYARKDMMIF